MSAAAAASPRSSAAWRLAVDIGGTFTDAVLLDANTGEVVVEKALTTPAAPLEGVKAALGSLLRRAGISPSDITAPIVHATTLVTNALIEGKTAQAAVVTTTGFGDTLEIRDEHRYDMYDLQLEFPPPPVPRSLVFELDERTNARGHVLSSPTPEALDLLVEQLRHSGAEAVGVCLLHSYANDHNELIVAAHLRAALGVPVCVSSDVAPEIREYPRMVTTACNAATMPVLGPYLAELQEWLVAEGFGGSVLMMLSNGGVVAADDAARLPIRLVESGPAAGALAGAWYARRLGEERLLCFDMGGTTAKSCLIEHAEPELSNHFEVARVYRFKKGSGFPCIVPSVDLVEIGAGGGSLARVDDLGLLKVGPLSAAADPGPASYGRGGTEPAVTDADLLLGNLDAGYFLGGEMPLTLDAAIDVTAKIAATLGVTIEDCAGGVHELVNASMAAASRMHAVERGVDVRGVPMIAFGGAGPVHACGVAELLESPRVIFPVNASVLSAFGTLVSPVRIDLARSRVSVLEALDPIEREAMLEPLREQARGILVSAGVDPSLVTFRYGLDARYLGQGNELTLWLGEGPAFPANPTEVLARFETEYRRVYGMSIPGLSIEAVTWRISALAPAANVPGVQLPAATGEAQPHHRRPVRFHRGQPPTDTPVYRRPDLAWGHTFDGPAIVEERETTAVIRPGWRAEVLPDGSILAHRGAPVIAGASANPDEGAHS
jgi:N-methylhydantoinase A